MILHGRREAEIVLPRLPEMYSYTTWQNSELFGWVIGVPRSSRNRSLAKSTL
jgi:hypothetical protein